jgi:hypothetical protein
VDTRAQKWCPFMKIPQVREGVIPACVVNVCDCVVPYRTLSKNLGVLGFSNNRKWKYPTKREKQTIWTYEGLYYRTMLARTWGIFIKGHHFCARVTVLVPLFFLLFINDLPESTESDARLFADDCLLFRPIRNNRDRQNQQNDLNSLEKWENRWQMAFHPEKCVVIRVFTKQQISWSYHEQRPQYRALWHSR